MSFIWRKILFEETNRPKTKGINGQFNRNILPDRRFLSPIRASVAGWILQPVINPKLMH